MVLKLTGVAAVDHNGLVKDVDHHIEVVVTLEIEVGDTSQISEQDRAAPHGPDVHATVVATRVASAR